MNIDIESLAATLRDSHVALGNPGQDLAGFSSSLVRISVREFTDEPSLRDAVRTLAPQAGWLTCQSSHRLISGPETLGDTPEAWIEGELLTAAGSLSLARLGTHWVLTRIEEGEGEPALVEVQHHLGSRGAPGALRYHVYWQLKDGVPQVIATAFRGFEGEAA